MIGFRYNTEGMIHERNVKRMIGEVTDWKKVFAKDTSESENCDPLLSKIHKELLKLKIRKQTTCSKNEPEAIKTYHQIYTDGK